eukprot:g3109.t1
MVNHQNIPFLNPFKSVNYFRANEFYLDPSFAAGQVFSSSIMDTLLCQSFYNPPVIEVVHQLMAGEDPVFAKQWNSQFQETPEFKDNIPKASHLFQIKVPSEFTNKTYGEMFASLVGRKGMLPIGLQRGVWKKLNQGPHGNVLPYCYVNPPQGCRVEKCDRVYVLCQKHPYHLEESSHTRQSLISMKKKKAKKKENMTDGKINPIKVMRRQTIMQKTNNQGGSLDRFVIGQRIGSKTRSNHLEGVTESPHEDDVSRKKSKELKERRKSAVQDSINIIDRLAGELDMMSSTIVRKESGPARVAFESSLGDLKEKVAEFYNTAELDDSFRPLTFSSGNDGKGKMIDDEVSEYNSKTWDDSERVDEDEKSSPDTRERNSLAHVMTDDEINALEL